MMVNRILLEKIQKSMDFFPVVGIVGPRQCGKTTLVRQLMAESHQKFTYLDCEHPRDLAKLTDPVLFLESNQDKCVVLDEIQAKPGLFPVLRSLIDVQKKPGRYVILGSASPDLIRDSSESLAGRISYHELSPFNILEVHRRSELTNHWFRGGFPDAFLQEDDDLRSEWFYNFVKTYVERDLPMLGLGLSPSVISRFWRMLATIHGNLLNKSNLSKSLEISYPTISRYLDFLEEAFLITQLYPFSANLKKRLVKSPKIYLRDSGVLHHQLNIHNYDELFGHSILGVSWEGYIIEQIRQKLPTG
ncbi:MAG: ATP-binding protein, partial [Calditrichaeota bacterium]